MDFLAARKRLAASAVMVAEPFGWSGAAVGECWHNVKLLVESLGGTFAYGWGLSDSGPAALSGSQLVPLYSRWVNHVLWRDANERLWEVTPNLDVLDRTVAWEPTHFIWDQKAQFEIASDEICCPRPAIYVAVRPEGEWTADCLCQAERASRNVQDDWVERALCAIRQAGLEPTSWRVKRVGDRLRDIWIMAK